MSAGAGLLRRARALTRYEWQSLGVNVALVVALVWTYIADFHVESSGVGSALTYLVVGVSLLSVYAAVELPRQKPVFSLNIQEFGITLVLLTLEPRVSIPMLILIFAHRAKIFGGGRRLIFYTSSTGLETVLIVSWAMQAHGALGVPGAVTPEVALAVLPWLVVAAISSFVIFALVHPDRSALATIRLLPKKAIFLGTLVYFAGTAAAVGFVAMLSLYPHDILASVFGIALVVFLMVTLLRQHGRTTTWTQASSIISELVVSPDSVELLLRQIRKLSPPASQVLYVEDPVSGRLIQACVSVTGLCSSSRFVDMTLDEVRESVPASGTSVKAEESWNPTGRSGWLTLNSAPKMLLLQIAPLFRLYALPRVPHLVETDMSTIVDSIWASLDRALQRISAEQQEAEMVTLPTLLESATDGFVTVREDGLIGSWNAAMVEWTGISEEEAVGRSMDCLLLPAPVLVADSDEPVIIVRVCSRTTYLQANVSRVYTSSGGDPVVLHTFRDLTPVIVAARTRSEMFTYITHELKNPVTSLLLHTELLAAEVGDDNESIAGLRESVEQLGAYVIDMAHISELSIAKSSPQNLPAVYGVRELLEQGWLTRMVSDREALEFVELNDFQVNVDQFRFRQLIRNLVSNALKYSCGKPVEVEYGSDGAVGMIRVSDRGEGIPEDARPKLFELYFQAPNSAGKPGDGVGLSVARRVSELLNGKLSYEPREGGGSVFTLTLPEVSRALVEPEHELA